MTSIRDRDWRLVREEARSGPMTMALEEIAAETAADGGPRTVRVYRWEPSTLSLGYHQDPETVDWAACEARGIDVTRRPTGGGGIYHDAVGDISYSIVAPAAELPGDLMECYELLCEPLLDALSRLGVDARFASDESPAVHQPACYLRAINPAHDVVAGDGRKVSGNAQYRQRDSVIQHGSLTFERATEPHLATFSADLDPSDFEARVTDVREQADVDRTTAVRTLEEALADWSGAAEGSWTDDELERARRRAERKYATDEWTFERVDPTDSST